MPKLAQNVQTRLEESKTVISLFAFLVAHFSNESFAQINLNCINF